MKNALINLSICLSDIDKTKIKQHENGKKYLNITIAGKKDGVDQDGNDTYAFISQTKEEKEAQEKKKAWRSGAGASSHRRSGRPLNSDLRRARKRRAPVGVRRVQQQVSCQTRGAAW